MIAHRMTLGMTLVAAALVAGPALAHPGHGPSEFPTGVLHQVVSLGHLPAAALWAALGASGVALGLAGRRRRLRAARAATARAPRERAAD